MKRKIIKNRGVVYTGKVGRRMKPKRHAASKRVVKRPVPCIGGPWRGAELWLSFGLPYTLPLVIRGAVGRYAGGVWIPG